MKSLRKTQTVFAVIIETVLALDIVGAIVRQEVSVSTFVCVAIIAMLQTAHCLLVERI